MYELEATAFRNFGITKFLFPPETLFNRSIDAILDSAQCLKEYFKFSTP
jgi:hypothetical protein